MSNKGSTVGAAHLPVNVVRVSVANVRVEHEVRLLDFTKWLEKPGGSPREVSDRKRLREILPVGFRDLAAACVVQAQ